MPTCEVSPHNSDCKREALEGDDKCILHSEDPEKDEEAFEEALKTHRKEHEGDFRYVVFPMKVDFSNITFEDAADFRGATFQKEASFVGAAVGTEINFFEATFEGAAIFQEATFGVEVLFGKAAFEAEAYFYGATFEAEADFRGVTFEAEVPFGGATFKAKADFRGATFEAEAVFSGVTFGAEAAFGGVTFEAEAPFRRASFEAVAIFHRAGFAAEAPFREATFGAVATFEEAIFGAVASFHETTFGAKADFRRVTFESKAIFSRTFVTSDEIRSVEATFKACEFGDDVLFSGESDKNRAFADGEVDFEDVTVAPDASLHFRYADLSRCRFLRTDLRDVRFTGVLWCEEVSSDGRYFNEWFRRVGIYDEVYQQNQEGDSEETDQEEGRESKDTPPWSEIERLYRQLKRNYEERGDFPRAGDFHIGEKVARRQNSRTHWAVHVLLLAYRALSKYGERASPAVLWLIGLIPTFALLYFALGATTCIPCEPVSYPDALLSSLESTFYPVQSVGFIDFWSQLFSIVQRIMSPILLALLALALRQRVKR